MSLPLLQPRWIGWPVQLISVSDLIVTTEEVNFKELDRFLNCRAITLPLLVFLHSELVWYMLMPCIVETILLLVIFSDETLLYEWYDCTAKTDKQEKKREKEVIVGLLGRISIYI